MRKVGARAYMSYTQKRKLEFLILPSQVSVSCVPSQNAVLPVIILSKAGAEHPHIASFCTKKTKNLKSWQKYHSLPIVKHSL